MGDTNRIAPVRIREPFAAIIKGIMARNLTTLTDEVNIAVREYLERRGLWPPGCEPEMTEPEEGT